MSSIWGAIKIASANAKGPKPSVHLVRPVGAAPSPLSSRPARSRSGQGGSSVRNGRDEARLQLTLHEKP